MFDPILPLYSVKANTDAEITAQIPRLHEQPVPKRWLEGISIYHLHLVYFGKGNQRKLTATQEVGNILKITVTTFHKWSFAEFVNRHWK